MRIQRLGEVHFLDAGLNCRGAHLTDPQVMKSLGQAVREVPLKLSIHLHGTPRQWGETGLHPVLLQRNQAEAH